ncbi:uncharacterized protein LOC114352811 [Ostrinia furnacalis]|uniref:uncharacterized protein LOC114352811 n=1 Tax=Ostrinia furnacalis TaxID=93504 RepID=UPI001038C9E3|nr:uncharacterized protein LOC114352811 [Ostrinia furnacalis]
MGTKSPTTSVKSREIIGVDAFSQRREVFDKHDTVFLPLPSPTAMTPVYRDAEPIVTSNHGKTTTNFKRNTAGYSSMRESKTDERVFDFRPRKYSDNFTSELNQSDDVDYRHSMMDRTRRLSKLRRDFLTSNLHEPDDKQFSRAGTRASLPTGKVSAMKYKIESPNLYKFPFAEPYATPPPVRRVVVDLGPSETDGKENQDPEIRPKHQSLTDSPTKVDHQKLFEQLVKRYSPQRKPIDWTLPPTKPRVVDSVPKSTSSVEDTVNKAEKSEENKPADDDVFEKKENIAEAKKEEEGKKEEIKQEHIKPHVEVIQNGSESPAVKEVEPNHVKERDSKVSLTELAEKNDRVPELSVMQRQLSRESTNHKKPLVEQPDISIPELINKMTVEGEKLESDGKNVKKVKRKRSFLDKLLGRKKDK